MCFTYLKHVKTIYRKKKKSWISAFKRKWSSYNSERQGLKQIERLSLELKHLKKNSTYSSHETMFIFYKSFKRLFAALHSKPPLSDATFMWFLSSSDRALHMGFLSCRHAGEAQCAVTTMTCQNVCCEHGPIEWRLQPRTYVRCQIKHFPLLFFTATEPNIIINN